MKIATSATTTMVMRALMLGSIATAVMAGAARAGTGDACEVTVRASDEIRAIVEMWVQTEPRCGAALEVTIVPAEGGLVLTADDARGGRRVRLVPDAQTAGVLIASWAADDRLVAPIEVAPAVSEVAPHRRALVTGIVGRALGARGEVDVLGHRFTLGLAVAGETGTVRGYGEQRTLQLIEYVGFGHAWTRWQLRAQLGAGVQVTDLQLRGETGEVFASGVDTLLLTEASVTLSRDLGGGWAVTAGALVSVLPSPDHTIDAMSVVTELPQVEPVALLGVSYTL
jgi:hypothetical protein